MSPDVWPLIILAWVMFGGGLVVALVVDVVRRIRRSALLAADRAYYKSLTS